MSEKVSECIKLITDEIEKQKNKYDYFEVTGLAKMGRIQGLEIAKKLLVEYQEEFC